MAKQKQSSTVEKNKPEHGRPQRPYDDLLNAIIDQLGDAGKSQQILDTIREHLDGKADGPPPAGTRRTLEIAMDEAKASDFAVRDKLDATDRETHCLRTQNREAMASSLSDISAEDFQVRDRMDSRRPDNETSRQRAMHSMQATMRDAVPDDFQVRSRLEAPRPDISHPRASVLRVLQNALTDGTQQDFAVRDKLDDPAHRERNTRLRLARAMLESLRQAEPEDYVVRQWLGDLRREYEEPALASKTFEATTQQPRELDVDEEGGRGVDQAVAESSPDDGHDTRESLSATLGSLVVEGRTAEEGPEQPARDVDEKGEDRTDMARAIDLDTPPAPVDVRSEELDRQKPTDAVSDIEEKLEALRALLGSPGQATPRDTKADPLQAYIASPRGGADVMRPKLDVGREDHHSDLVAKLDTPRSLANSALNNAAEKAAAEKAAAEKAAAEKAAAEKAAAEKAAAEKAAALAIAAEEADRAARPHSATLAPRNSGRATKATPLPHIDKPASATRQVAAHSLEDRFAALARQIETSLATLNPTAAIQAIDTKLDALTSRFDAAMQTRVNQDALAAIEEQLAAVLATVNESKGNSQRLQVLEDNISRLTAIVDQLEDKIAHLSATAMPPLAMAAADAERPQDGPTAVPHRHEHSIFSGIESSEGFPQMRDAILPTAGADAIQSDEAMATQPPVPEFSHIPSEETDEDAPRDDDHGQTTPDIKDTPNSAMVEEPHPQSRDWAEAPLSHDLATPTDEDETAQSDRTWQAFDEDFAKDDAADAHAHASLSGEPAEDDDPQMADVFRTPQHDMAARQEPDQAHAAGEGSRPPRDAATMSAPLTPLDAHDGTVENAADPRNVPAIADDHAVVTQDHQFANPDHTERAPQPAPEDPPYSLAVPVDAPRGTTPTAGTEPVRGVAPVSDSRHAVATTHPGEAPAADRDRDQTSDVVATEAAATPPKVVAPKKPAKGKQSGGISADLRERLIMRAAAPSQNDLYSNMKVRKPTDAGTPLHAPATDAAATEKPAMKDAEAVAGKPIYETREDFLAAARRASIAVATQALESDMDQQATRERFNRDELTGDATSNSARQKANSGSLLVLTAVFLLITSGLLLYGKMVPGNNGIAASNKSVPAKPAKFGEHSNAAPSGKSDLLPQIQKYSMGGEAGNTARSTNAAPAIVTVTPEPATARVAAGQTAAPTGAASAEGQAAPAPSAPTAIRTSNVPMPPATIGRVSLRIAASKGDPKAQYEVASRFLAGKGVKRDYMQAAIWFKRAAAQGFAPAQYRLGTLYERGRGVIKDLARAKIWYRRAADAGNVRAMHNFAVLHTRRGLGDPDYATAAQWFEKAARHGLTDSQFNLGIMFHNGLGVRRNDVEAYKWFALAAAAGDKEAEKNRALLAKKLSAGDSIRARRAVAGFKPLPKVASANIEPGPRRSYHITATSNPRHKYIRTNKQAAKVESAPKADPDVKRVQQLLKRAGYQPGPADGRPGPKTREAIRAFERQMGIKETGEISEDLIIRLEAMAT